MTAAEMEPIDVLHVDDDPDFVDMAATFLERADERIAVETAPNPIDGLERLDEGRFDCIVSDYDMPRQDGIEFLETVRAERPDLPFILYTGQGSEVVAADAISAGATDYLQKETGSDQYTILANRIRNAVEQYRATERAAELDRIRALVSTVDQALVRADDRTEIESRVCAVFSEAEPYCFAWIGGVDPDSGVIAPRASAGIEEGYLAEISVTTDSTPTGQGPAGTAARERRVSVSQDVQADPDFEPWREQALERGFQSVAAIPLAHGDTLYGVLCVYADRPNAFDGTERSILAELGDDIAHAIDSLRIQAQLREQRRNLERYERILDALGDPVYALDPEGHFTFVNDALVELTGYAEEELVGEDASILVDRATVETATTVFKQLLDNPDRTHDTFEFELVTADGDVVVCENHVALLPLEDDRYGTTGVVRDITDRKRNNRELERRTEELEALTHELKAQYRYLFEQAPVMAVVTRSEDGTPVVEDCNRRFVETLGYDRDDVLGRTLSDFYTPESRRALLNGGYERALSGEFVREDRELVTAAGGTVETLLRAVPRQDTETGEAGTLALFVDITERKTLEQEKQRLEEFTSVVSHDLRNPLNVAQGRVELAREECETDHLDAAGVALDRMAELIEDLLSLARSGDRIDGTVPVDLRSAVEDGWGNVEVADATIAIETERTIRADRSRLGQLFENLFRNAIEHGGAGVSVTVGDTDDGFYVADDGPGIPAERRDAVFDAGYSTTDDGTGFGLSIVKQVANAHGWTVRATAGSAGGARFEITGVEFVDG
jgi:PAS domain S-box-containing protein